MSIANEIETAPEQLLTEEEIMHFRVLPVFLIGLELTMAFHRPTGQRGHPAPAAADGAQGSSGLHNIFRFRCGAEEVPWGPSTVSSRSSRLSSSKNTTSKCGKHRRKHWKVSAIRQWRSLTEEVLLRAAKAGASDIHVEPMDEELMIRFRVDGVLHREVSLPLSYHPGMASVLKSKSGMDMLNTRSRKTGDSR